MSSIRLLNPFLVEHHTLFTTLTAEECARRLEELIIPFPFTRTWFRTNDPLRLPLLGQVSDQGFEIQKAGQQARHSFPTTASGLFVQVRDGTRIEVRTGLHPLAQLIGVAAFAFVLLVSVIIVFASLAGSGTSGVHPIIAALLVPAFLLLLIGAYVFGRWESRDDGDFLLRLLSATLDCEEIDGRRAGGS